METPLVGIELSLPGKETGANQTTLAFKAATPDSFDQDVGQQVLQSLLAAKLLYAFVAYETGAGAIFSTTVATLDDAGIAEVLVKVEVSDANPSNCSIKLMSMPCRHHRILGGNIRVGPAGTWRACQPTRPLGDLP